MFEECSWCGVRGPGVITRIGHHVGGGPDRLAVYCADIPTCSERASARERIEAMRAVMA